MVLSPNKKVKNMGYKLKVILGHLKDLKRQDHLKSRGLIEIIF